jgi:hypothetical protein
MMDIWTGDHRKIVAPEAQIDAPLVSKSPVLVAPGHGRLSRRLPIRKSPDGPIINPGAPSDTGY